MGSNTKAAARARARQAASRPAAARPATAADDAKVDLATTGGVTPKSRRFEEFLAMLDREIGRAEDQLGGLHARLGFLIYDGPQTTGDEPTGAGATNDPIPSNEFETALRERIHRLAALNARFSRLHIDLRL